MTRMLSPHVVPVLGELVPDFANSVLETGYSRFDSSLGIHGLAKVAGSVLDLLVVHAHEPGTGDFRRFVAACKAAYETIYVWEVWNDRLAVILERYGFTPHQGSEDGILLEGWRWSR